MRKKDVGIALLEKNLSSFIINVGALCRKSKWNRILMFKYKIVLRKIDINIFCDFFLVIFLSKTL